MEKNVVLDVIVTFLEAIKDGRKNKLSRGEMCISYKSEIREYKIKNVGYLLNQIIRQYEVPKSHYLISKKAKELWESVTDENIDNYYYKMSVKCKPDTHIKLMKYIGASKTPTQEIDLSKKKRFCYNDIFHDDHIIPVSVIIEKLLALDNPTYDKVECILDKIYYCRLTKGEDRAVNERNKRPFDVGKVIKEIYLGEHGIEIVHDDNYNQLVNEYQLGDL